MNYFGTFAAVIGLVMGISITFQIERLLNRPATSPISVVDTTNARLSTLSKNSSDMHITRGVKDVRLRSAVQDIKLAKLKQEKARLEARLKLVDAELERATISTVAAVKGPPMLSPSSNEGPMKAKVLSNSLTRGIAGSTNELKNMPVSDCPYSFKVYVYEIPATLPSVYIAEEARRNGTLHVCQKCILEQFSLEYIVQDFFTGFCGRTYNADEADYFYLPIIRDAEFRVAMSHGARNRAPSASEQALLHMLEHNDSTMWMKVFNVTDKYWNRRAGGDHIIVMPAPVTNLRHESSQRGFFHYMMHLHPPIFLCLEYSVDFVKEYPICSSRKNIVMPYPTTDPDLYNGRLIASHIKRAYLLYYAGGMHGDCIQVRKAMKMLMVNSTKIPGVVPPIRSVQAEREHGFLAATFCPVPVGDSPSSKRMYDVLNFGCIPVVLSDDLVWAYSHVTGGKLNNSQFSIHMPQSVVHYTAHHTLRKYFSNREELGVLPSGVLLYDLLEQSANAGGDYLQGSYVNPVVQILRRIPKSDVEYLASNVAAVAPHFRYYEMNSSMKVIPTRTHAYPTGGAIVSLAELLEQRKADGLAKLMNECQAERRRSNHKYVARYECDTSKMESLVRRRRLLRYMF